MISLLPSIQFGDEQILASKLVCVFCYVLRSTNDLNLFGLFSDSVRITHLVILEIKFKGHSSIFIDIIYRIHICVTHEIVSFLMRIHTFVRWFCNNLNSVIVRVHGFISSLTYKSFFNSAMTLYFDLKIHEYSLR